MHVTQPYLLIDNIKSIMLYCDIITIKNICLTCKLLSSINDKSFWSKKFTFDNIKIIQDRDDYMKWIYEYILSKSARVGLDNIINIVCHYEMCFERSACIKLRNFMSYIDINFVNSYYS